MGPVDPSTVDGGTYMISDKTMHEMGMVSLYHPIALAVKIREACSQDSNPIISIKSMSACTFRSAFLLMWESMACVAIPRL